MRLVLSLWRNWDERLTIESAVVRLVMGLIPGCNLCERNTFGGVCQLILCHNSILIIGVTEATKYNVHGGLQQIIGSLAKIIGERQSLQINS